MSDLAVMQAILEDTVNTKTIRKNLRMEVAKLHLINEKFSEMENLLSNWMDIPENWDDSIAAMKELFSDAEICEKILLAVSYATVEPKPIQAIGAVLAQELCYACPFEGVDVAVTLLEVTTDSDLFDILLKPGAHKIYANFTLPDSLLRSIELAQFPLPMISIPLPLNPMDKSNMDTSHFIQRGSLILGKMHHHNEHICKDVLNILNATPLALDIPTVQEDEVSNKPLDTPDKRKQFAKLAKDSADVYMELISLGNRFYLTNAYDSRGRAYMQGYHVNLQSTDYKKASISLADQEVMS